MSRMLTVDEYGRIRRAHRDGMSIREIAREFHHSRYKVREVLHGEGEPQKYRRRETQNFPMLAPVLDRVRFELCASSWLTEAFARVDS